MRGDGERSLSSQDAQLQGCHGGKTFNSSVFKYPAKNVKGPQPTSIMSERGSKATPWEPENRR